MAHIADSLTESAPTAWKSKLLRHAVAPNFYLTQVLSSRVSS